MSFFKGAPARKDKKKLKKGSKERKKNLTSFPTNRGHIGPVD